MNLIVTKFILSLTGLEKLILKEKPPNMHDISDLYDFKPLNLILLHRLNKIFYLLKFIRKTF